MTKNSWIDNKKIKMDNTNVHYLHIPVYLYRCTRTFHPRTSKCLALPVIINISMYNHQFVVHTYKNKQYQNPKDTQINIADFDHSNCKSIHIILRLYNHNWWYISQAWHETHCKIFFTSFIRQKHLILNNNAIPLSALNAP